MYKKKKGKKKKMLRSLSLSSFIIAEQKRVIVYHWLKSLGRTVLYIHIQRVLFFLRAFAIFFIPCSKKLHLVRIGKKDFFNPPFTRTHTHTHFFILYFRSFLLLHTKKICFFYPKFIL